ncbi:hypothetical protein LZG75_08845 [Polynucleobacter sp. IMCC30063]|uniref:hypothetical protein n=1 Tax=Polynucleobacter sp. IMCC30063 TaxID=2907298 RepID=UPI001F35F30E|nr:hypothetical protein [Polynucleobacter sp. IMCC30063]MCE7506347.1 hypothetical protein [Polynucleobacter sp. IMCC30063]
MLLVVNCVGVGRQLRFWQAGVVEGGGQFPTLSIAALVDVTEVETALFEVALFAVAPLGPPALTALAEVTPVTAPPEATSLPPPQDAKAMTEVAQIKMCFIDEFIFILIDLV